MSVEAQQQRLYEETSERYRSEVARYVERNRVDLSHAVVLKSPYDSVDNILVLSTNILARRSQKTYIIDESGTFLYSFDPLLGENFIFFLAGNSRVIDKRVLNEKVRFIPEMNRLIARGLSRGS